MLHQAIAEATTPLPPLLPSEYIRLRRQAAGLTLDDVAARIAPRPSERTTCLAFLRLWERSRVVAQPGALLQLQRAFPIDPDVYRQLATEPAERHPHVCRGCGCTRWDPCSDGHQCCGWTDDSETLCTRCSGGPHA